MDQLNLESYIPTVSVTFGELAIITSTLNQGLYLSTIGRFETWQRDEMVPRGSTWAYR